MQVEGLVDGCVSPDGDALVFGARTVYKELHLQTASPENAQLVRCDANVLQSHLGIAEVCGFPKISKLRHTLITHL